jgi:hypothetical protein
MDLSLMTETLTKLWGQFVEVIPNFVGALTIFIIGFIIAKIASRVVTKLLEKIQINKFGDKLAEIDIFQKANLKINLAKIFGKIIYYFLLLFFMVAATDVLNMPAISNLVTGMFNLIPKLIVGFIILIFGILLADGIRGIVQTTLTSLGLPSAKMIASFLFYFLFINVIISAIAQAEINTAFLEQNISIVIGGGILAFAIGYGLASKDSVGNFLASFYANGKIAVGDTIELDNAKGEIINMDKNSVTILSGDRHIVYPLKKLLNEKISIYK